VIKGVSCAPVHGASMLEIRVGRHHLDCHTIVVHCCFLGGFGNAG